MNNWKSSQRDVIDTLETLKIDTSADPSPVVVKAWCDAYQTIDALRRELESECDKQLTAPQKSRFQQILFQSLGAQALLVSNSACDALELTAQQREELRQIQERMAKSQNFSNLLCKALRNTDDVSLLLSEPQLKQLQKLKGNKIPFCCNCDGSGHSERALSQIACLYQDLAEYKHRGSVQIIEVTV